MPDVTAHFSNLRKATKIMAKSLTDCDWPETGRVLQVWSQEASDAEQSLAFGQSLGFHLNFEDGIICAPQARKVWGGISQSFGSNFEYTTRVGVSKSIRESCEVYPKPGPSAEDFLEDPEALLAGLGRLDRGPEAHRWNSRHASVDLTLSASKPRIHESQKGSFLQASGVFAVSIFRLSQLRQRGNTSAFLCDRAPGFSQTLGPALQRFPQTALFI